MSISAAAGVGIWKQWATSARQKVQAGTATGQESSAATDSGSTKKSVDPVSTFTELMKGTAEQRMFKAWLSRHHLNQEQYDALPTDEKKKLAETFRKELKDSLKGGIEAPSSVDIVV